MSHNFKPGDLALIVGAHTTADNIGKVCELIEFLIPEQVSNWRAPEDGMRIKNGDVGPAWVVVGEGLLSWCEQYGWSLVDPAHLMPLRAEYAPEQQKSREVLA
jgi:hypothetical protein